MTCKDCIHFYDVCGCGLVKPEDDVCCSFKDKSRFIELPCRLGAPIFRVLYINTPGDEYYCSFSKGWVIGQGNFNLNDIEAFGKAVFLTREEAEAKLKEMEDNRIGEMVKGEKK